MNPRVRFGIASIIAICSATGALAQAISDDIIKIGVLTDMAGAYSDVAGPGTTHATKMAVDDCLAKECKGLNIEVLAADSQNKPDIGLGITKGWLENTRVDALVGLTNSAIAIGIAGMLKDNPSAVALFTEPSSSRLTNEACTEVGFHWMHDTYAIAAAPIRSFAAMGLRDWYFLTVDYTFGHQLEADATAALTAAGGKVVGSSKHPLDARDFASFLLSAQASNADVVAFANAGADTINAIKQAGEFGLSRKQKLFALLLMSTDIQGIGLELSQGLTYVAGYYPGQDADAQAFADRFAEGFGKPPTMLQAAAYSSTLHYLRSVVAAKTDHAPTVAKKMKELKIEDPVMRNASIRPDGRVIHDMYLVQAKAPSESKGEWDLEKLVSVIPADEAFIPLSKSKCPLVAN